MSDVVPSAPGEGNTTLPTALANSTTTDPDASSPTDLQFSIGVAVGAAITVILVLAAFRGILCRKIIHSRAYQELKRRMRRAAGETGAVREPEVRSRERRRIPSLMHKEEEELREVHSIGVIPRRRVHSLEEPKRLSLYTHTRSPSVWTLPTITLTPADQIFRDPEVTFSNSTEVLHNSGEFFRRSGANFRNSHETIRRSNESFRHFRKTGDHRSTKSAIRARAGSTAKEERESSFEDIFSGRRNTIDPGKVGRFQPHARTVSVEEVVVHRNDVEPKKKNIEWEQRNGIHTPNRIEAIKPDREIETTRF